MTRIVVFEMFTRGFTPAWKPAVWREPQISRREVAL